MVDLASLSVEVVTDTGDSASQLDALSSSADKTAASLQGLETQSDRTQTALIKHKTGTEQAAEGTAKLVAQAHGVSKMGSATQKAAEETAISLAALGKAATHSGQNLGEHASETARATKEGVMFDLHLAHLIERFESGHVSIRAAAPVLREWALSTSDATKGATYLGSSISGVAESLGFSTGAFLIGATGVAAFATGMIYTAVQSHETRRAIEDMSKGVALGSDITAAAFEKEVTIAAQTTALTRAAAADIGLAYEKTGNMTQTSLHGMVEATVQFARATGKTNEESAKQLAALFENPAKGLDELQREIGLGDAAWTNYTKSLALSGHEAEANEEISKRLQERLHGVSTEAQGLEHLTAVWKFLQEGMRDWNITIEKAIALTQRETVSVYAEAEALKILHAEQEKEKKTERDRLSREADSATRSYISEMGAIQQADAALTKYHDAEEVGVKLTNADILMRGRLNTLMRDSVAAGGAEYMAQEKANAVYQAQVQAIGAVTTAEKAAAASAMTLANSFGTATTATERNAAAQRAASLVMLQAQHNIEIEMQRINAANQAQIQSIMAVTTAQKAAAASATVYANAIGTETDALVVNTKAAAASAAVYAHATAQTNAMIEAKYRELHILQLELNGASTSELAAARADNEMAAAGLNASQAYRNVSIEVAKATEALREQTQAAQEATQADQQAANAANSLAQANANISSSAANDNGTAPTPQAWLHARQSRSEDPSANYNPYDAMMVAFQSSIAGLQKAISDAASMQRLTEPTAPKDSAGALASRAPGAYGADKNASYFYDPNKREEFLGQFGIHGDAATQRAERAFQLQMQQYHQQLKAYEDAQKAAAVAQQLLIMQNYWLMQIAERQKEYARDYGLNRFQTGAAVRSTPSPPGFATGGDFLVSGSPGEDVNLVSMRLTAGELVSVRTPEQQKSAQTGSPMVVNVTINANDLGNRESRASIVSGVARAMAQATKNRNG